MRDDLGDSHGGTGWVDCTSLFSYISNCEKLLLYFSPSCSLNTYHTLVFALSCTD